MNSPDMAQGLRPWLLPRAGWFDLAAASGRTYRIFVAWPGTEAPRCGFPVIYLLDANACFATVVETMRRAVRRPEATGIEPAILVGIGSPDAELYAPERQLDFTFMACGAESGGGADFLQVLTDRLFSRIEAMFPADPRRRGLFGHSLGGLFALSVFLTHPGLFRDHLAVSPSIWWNPAGLAVLARVLPQRLVAAPAIPRLLMTVGEYEEKQAPWIRAPMPDRQARLEERRMVSNVLAMHEQLAAWAPQAASAYRILSGADHGSALTASIEHGLRLVSADAIPVGG